MSPLLSGSLLLDVPEDWGLVYVRGFVLHKNNGFALTRPQAKPMECFLCRIRDVQTMLWYWLLQDCPLHALLSEAVPYFCLPPAAILLVSGYVIFF